MDKFKSTCFPTVLVSYSTCSTWAPHILPLSSVWIVKYYEYCESFISQSWNLVDTGLLRVIYSSIFIVAMYQIGYSKVMNKIYKSFKIVLVVGLCMLLCDITIFWGWYKEIITLAIKCFLKLFISDWLDKVKSTTSYLFHFLAFRLKQIT